MLPFLKNKSWPRIAKPMEEKSYGFDSSDKLQEHCFGEMCDAIQEKNVGKFRRALEALVMSMFEDMEDSDGSADSGKV